MIYLFKDDQARTDFIHRKYRKDLSAEDQGVDPLHRLASHMLTFGRPPRPSEKPDLLASLLATYGSMHRAIIAAKHLLTPAAMAQARRRRKSDLVVALALDTFYGRASFGELPPAMRADVKAFYGTYSNACSTAGKLLVAAGQPDLVKRAMISSRTGKLSPTALYIHKSALDELVALLRIYEACARIVAGTPDGANLMKLHHDQPAVSYLTCPDFDKDPHPYLAASLFVHIGQQKTSWTQYPPSPHRPLLHRKEEFVAQGHPQRARWARLTTREVKAGLYDDPVAIGTEQGWRHVLDSKGLVLSGHRLISKQA
ncbi:DNA phosphorothioation-associated putative methyltransferase [Nonomuraea turkmeniaca]|uniref:DNA phosphorothioation-associated putative methyltransferase n=1 Tax=Nonomuraea turkmeniaca TaxID=103838 RepID=UPI001476E411|nr:DNA phosphorothioation-associated putative methyltransferase [Nonomuraea turkmeniaca]